MAEPGQSGAGPQQGDGPAQPSPPGPNAGPTPTPSAPLRAAQLRNRTIRGGLVRIALGTAFLVGAIAHGLSPQRHEQSSLFWITLLLVMSTANVALGFRLVARARWGAGRSWTFIAAAWGFLAVMLLGLLLRR